ncbi:hypothetical protein GCM10023085_59160 [Actinomadura viridis]|uniref:Uncharacterized protein n=1 Tax=Actinomadura viridis TaxID=58110 RepID=A0A931GNU1_9ACTN|nr:hypothetical protein [Actinomadura viridis]MBG6093290.1 hypothetical protein [Actinomadura viridis]
MSQDKQIFLHIGAPLVGAGAVQEALWHHGPALAEHGIRYPLEDPHQHFAATMDLREMSWGGHRDPAWIGVWDRLAERVRAWDGGRVVLSQELLGGATAAQARRAVESFGPGEVHIVFTARDLARQMAADWQEHVKHEHTVTFDEFVDDLVMKGIDAPPPFGEMFWGLHDPVRVLRAWGAAVPRERVHVIVAPRGGPGRSGGAGLWARFAELTGIAPEWCDLAAVHEPEPLGLAEAELLRRVNERLDFALGGDYEPLVRRHLANGLLAARTGGTEIVLPVRHHPWMRTRSRELIEGLDAAGYDVIGDLADLMPDFVNMAPAGPAEPSALTDAAVEVIEALLRDLARSRERAQIAEINHELAQVREQLARLTALPPTRPSVMRRSSGRSRGSRGRG